MSQEQKWIKEGQNQYQFTAEFKGKHIQIIQNNMKLGTSNLFKGSNLKLVICSLFKRIWS